MKKLKTIFLIWIFSTLLFSGYAQNSLEAFADTLANKGLYQHALKEYLRCVFHEEKLLSKDIYIKISDMFLKMEQHQKALEYLDLHYYKYFDQNPEKNNVLFKKTQILFHQQKPEEALSNILQVVPSNIHDSDRKYFYLGILNVALKKETESFEALSKLSYIHLNDHKELNSKIKYSIKKASKNPNLALAQSALIPGLGQTLQGNINDGLKSFILVGSLGVLFVDINLSYSFTDALLSVGPWLTRYYIGGMVNASKQTEKRNERVLNASILELITYLKTCQN